MRLRPSAWRHSNPFVASTVPQPERVVPCPVVLARARGQFRGGRSMPDQDQQNPNTGSQSDISKAQSQQQPPTQASQQQSETGERSEKFETSQQGSAWQSGDQAATGQSQSGSADEGLQGDTLAQQRTDVEGAGLSGSSGEAGGQSSSGFVGSQGQQDSSSQLVNEADEDFAQDGQGAPEGE